MKLRYTLPLVLVLLLGPAHPVHAQDGAEPVVATDLLQIRELDGVTLSPDGRSVVYTVRRAIEKPGEEEAYRYRTQLYMVPASGREAPRQLTFDDAGASQPAWHPDGEALAFVRPVDGRPQIFVMTFYGGEAYQLTDAEHGATAPHWSPEGDRILYASAIPERAVYDEMQRGPSWPHERPNRTFADAAGREPDPSGSLAEIRAWLAQNAEDGKPRVLHRLDLQGEHDLEPTGSYRHVFVIDAQPGADARAVTTGYRSFNSAAWLADGRIVVSGAVDEERHPDRVRDGDLFITDSTGSALDLLLDIDGYAVFDPQVAPGGEHVAFRARRLDELGYAQTELGVVSLVDAGNARLLTEGFDRSVGTVKWAPDGWHLYFTAASDGGFPLYRISAFPKRAPEAAGRADSLSAILRAAELEEGADSLDAEQLIAADTAAVDTTVDVDSVDADTSAAAAPVTAATEVERLTGFGRGVRSFGVSEASVYFVITEPSNPYELYAASLSGTAERRLTSHNAAWLANKRLSLPEPDTLVRDDGLAIPYWVMKPAPFDESRTYPLLLEIHGGPMAMWGPGEASMWHEFQFFASHGYGIVFSNPRGSGGYGEAVRRANYQDWGAGPAGDVLAVAEEALATRPWLDPDRQVVTGGSYAGYLTAWIVAHDDRFRAAVAQRGVYDLVTFLGEGNAWRLIPSHFGGYPWETLPSDTVGTAPAAARADTVSTRSRVDEMADALARAVSDSLAAARDSLVADEAAVGDTAAVDTGETYPQWISDTDTVALPPDSASDTIAAPLPDSDARLPATDLAHVRALLVQQSPLTYASQIDTPLLIMHADDDLRTGVIQSEMLYKTLKIMEKPVEYVRYPDSGHDLSRTGDPRLRIDRLLRIYEFFERYIDHQTPILDMEATSATEPDSAAVQP